ncbi:hypothetical protein CC2G_009501 [Coprinopsis cinerea AmutBmut pab1-1]|nr:hypothetical protein CC2G_009501 [Coprinopsis cinerea AmutBmut pab1-1]
MGFVRISGTTARTVRNERLFFDSLRTSLSRAGPSTKSTERPDSPLILPYQPPVRRGPGASTTTEISPTPYSTAFLVSPGSMAKSFNFFPSRTSAASFGVPWLRFQAT